MQTVKFRDFFPRMGYRVKLDVPDDKINQATAPYLNGRDGRRCNRRPTATSGPHRTVSRERALCMEFLSWRVTEAYLAA